MNTAIKWVIGIVVVGLVGWGVYVVNNGGEERDQYKIGAILPITGPISFLGEEVRDALLLAEEDLDLEVIMEDSALDPKTGVGAVNKLKDTDEVREVIVWGTPIISAVQPITEESKMVLVGGSISPGILASAEYTLRVFYNLEQALERMSGLIKQKEWEEVAVLYQNGEAWERQVQGLEKMGVEFSIKEAFNSGETDFRTQLFKIKSENPEVVIVLGYGNNLPIIMKQRQETGLEAVILGGLDFVELPTDTDRSLFEGAVFVVPKLITEGKKGDFAVRFENKFGYWPSHQAAYAYDAAQMLKAARENTDGGAEAIMSYIKGQESFAGVVGQIKIKENGDTRSELELATYKGGEIVKYEE